MMTKDVGNKKIEEKMKNKRICISGHKPSLFVELQFNWNLHKEIHAEPAFEYFISLNVALQNEWKVECFWIYKLLKAAVPKSVFSRYENFFVRPKKCLCMIQE